MTRELRKKVEAGKSRIRLVRLKPSFATYLAQDFMGGGCEGGACKEHPAQAMLGVPVIIDPTLTAAYQIEYSEF